MRAAGILTVVVLALAACGPSEASLSPTQISQRGGAELRVGLVEAVGDGGLVILIDGVPAQDVVVEAPRLVRARVPSLPRTGTVDVELLFGDGRTLTLADALEVAAPRLEVEARAPSEGEAEAE